MEAAPARTEPVQVLDFVPTTAKLAPMPAPVIGTIKPAKPASVTEIPSGIMAIAALLYATMFAGLGWGFTGAAAAGFIALVAVVAFALVREFGGGMSTFMRGTIETATGPISGKAAVALVLTVPACLTAAAVAIGIAFRVLQ
jgi:hypothetical protein